MWSDLCHLVQLARSERRFDDATLLAQFKEYPAIHKAGVTLNLWLPWEIPTVEGLDAITTMLCENLGIDRHKAFKCPLSRVVECLDEQLNRQEARTTPAKPPSLLTLPTEGPAEGKSGRPFPDPLQAIRDNLQRRESELANQADRVARRQQLDERLANRFKEVISFACSSLARDDRSRTDAFFPDLARSLLAFNEALRAADREYPRFRILDRLERASQAGVPALDTAATLLLLEPTTDVTSLATDLKRIQESRPHDVWSMWLTYILDQLMNSHRPPTKDSVPPDTSRDEWRQAELAFGCVLFSDESFRVLQESMDHAACLIDDALKCGGQRVLSRPPGRVRDLIARFDPRALHWYGSEFRPLPLLQPPPSIEAITEPVALRRQLDEVWTAATCLQIALDKWAAWFIELREKGDAHPAIALNCSDMAHRAVKVLLTHRPNVEPFDGADEAALLGMLPPIPAWWVPGSSVEQNTESAELIEKPRVRWQEDREFLDAYYWPPEQRQQKATKLRGAAAQLIDLLKSFPMTAHASSRTNDRREGVGEIAVAATPLNPQPGASAEGIPAPATLPTGRQSTCSFRWLHLTDLHFGMPGQKWLWPNMQEEFFRDLARLHEKAGPWDLILFTGDFVQRGAADEFAKLNDVLVRVWEKLCDLGSTPLLLGVPGNHDLVRQRAGHAAVASLRTGWADAHVQKEFWVNPKSDYRKVVHKAFKNYLAWWEACTLPRPDTYRPGLLPGDFSATLEKAGCKLGIVGLNTAFLQLEGGDYTGRLALSAQQFHESCGGDGAAWTNGHHVCFLLTHHPPNWLLENARQELYGEIAIPGRFAVHLFGHMHEASVSCVAQGGADVRRELQGRSLFGLEEWGENGNKKQRLHGYSAGAIDLKGDTSLIRLWPRRAERHQAQHLHIVPDHSFTLEDEAAHL
jgi:hypothetical protein